MPFYRVLLIPFSWVFACGVWLRNFFFDIGIFRSTSFPLPVISVGNLSVGGTGKTPHIEYLIRLLKNNYKVATLSRGYGRTTKGFMLVSNPSTAAMIGDEPMQYHHKFKDILVSVGEDRVAAIENLLEAAHKPEVILLDDAFQHRSVKPGLNILLIDYASVFKKNYFLPAGTLREGHAGIKRADIIIISKTPDILVPLERRRLLEQFQLSAHQQVFFSYYKYGELTRLSTRHSSMLMGSNYYFDKQFSVLLITGIANPSGIEEYLKRRVGKLETLFFPDHHPYTSEDILQIQGTFNNIANPNRIIVTTEKDAMRLRNPELEDAVDHLPFFYLPVEVAIHEPLAEKFNLSVLSYVRQNQTNRSVH